MPWREVYRPGLLRLYLVWEEPADFGRLHRVPPGFTSSGLLLHYTFGDHRRRSDETIGRHRLTLGKYG